MNSFLNICNTCVYSFIHSKFNISLVEFSVSGSTDTQMQGPHFMSTGAEISAHSPAKSFPLIFFLKIHHKRKNKTNNIECILTKIGILYNIFLKFAYLIYTQHHSVFLKLISTMYPLIC